MPTLKKFRINNRSTPSAKETTDDSFLDQLTSVCHLNLLSNIFADKNNSIPSFCTSPALMNLEIKPDVGVTCTGMI